MLLLTLTLLPITPTAAVGPKPQEKADITIVGDITGIASDFDVGLHGKLTIVYGDVDLTFKEPNQGDWLYFNNDGKLGIRMDKKTGEVHIIYMFDEYTEADGVSKRYWGAKKYQLETYGTFSRGSIPYGTVEVDNEVTIYQIKYQETSKKNGKGAFGVTYVPFLEGVDLSFTITIN